MPDTWEEDFCWVLFCDCFSINERNRKPSEAEEKKLQISLGHSQGASESTVLKKAEKENSWAERW